MHYLHKVSRATLDQITFAKWAMVICSSWLLLLACYLFSKTILLWYGILVLNHYVAILMWKGSRRDNFIYENTLPAEKEELKKQMKKSKDPEAINELKGRMSQIDKELKSAATKRTEKDILAEHKKKEREAAKKGKQPYYLKKSEIRTQKLAEKYKELKESGKLEAFIEKRRRKNAAKDHRYIPYRRPMEQGSHTQLATRLDDAKRLAGASLPAFLPPPLLPPLSLPFTSVSHRQGKHTATSEAATTLNSDYVARRLTGTSVYTVSNTNNELVLISDTDGAKSIGLLCFRREDAEAFLAHVRSRRGEVKGGAKVMLITLDQVRNIHKWMKHYNEIGKWVLKFLNLEHE
ncbi:rRNA biogenesis RRP36-like protein [Perilla frutescens var. frutescens]|nr:rRNA biogenesis RRP36-like protein [Perilla frutescens var. frutescens]